MTSSTFYPRHRFPAEIIAHAVWLHARFPLSLRLVEEMFLERGIEVSYETVRRWGMTFGSALARELGRGTPRPSDVWNLDEVRVVIRGRVHRFWRAVDQHGVVLDEIPQRRLLLRLLKRQGWRPRRIVTDKQPSYGAAKREVAPSLEHRAPTRGSTTGSRTATSPSENGSGRCRASDRRESSKLRLRLLRGAQPLCSTRPTPLRPRHPPPPSRSARRMAAGRGPRGLRTLAISTLRGCTRLM